MRGVLVSAVVGIAALGSICDRYVSAPPPIGAHSSSAQARVPEAVVAAGTSVHDFATRAEAPGSFVHRHVPRAGAGIPCPDGTFMPPLNGVLASDPIPRIEREPFMPPIGEIVGKWTDSDGAAWWVTEDGSAFTTRWVSVVDADGRARQLVRLDQSDRLREGLGRDR